MEWAEPPTLPPILLPEAPELPLAVLEVPRAELPSYTPFVVPPNTLRPPPGIKGINVEESPPEKEKDSKKADKGKSQTNKSKDINIPPETQIVEIPFTDIEVPMPSTTIMTTAATTAFISVAATLTATSLFKYLVMVFKPVFKQTWNKITKKKNKKKDS